MLFLVWLVILQKLVNGELINGTGGSFPTSVYQESTFAYQFAAEDIVRYFATGSSGGKCNIKGYWSSSNIDPLYPAPSAERVKLDQLDCDNKCTTATCGFNSNDPDRPPRSLRKPIVDFVGSDSLLKSSDYTYFPDIQMFPAVAGAAVPIYNIPELNDLNDSMVLSRETIVKIFVGDIRKWNDSRILADNSGEVLTILRNLDKDITVTVRTDGSGTTEIFTVALVLFDPSTNGQMSFASYAGSGSSPKWCGPSTDEITIIETTSCSSNSDKSITITLVDIDSAPYDVTFSCDNSAAELSAIFQSTKGIYLNISKEGDTFLIGYSDSAYVAKNLYKPLLKSSGPSSVSISTLQEGGYLQNHYNQSYFEMNQIQSLIVLNTKQLSVQLNLTTSDSSVYSMGLLALNSSDLAATSTAIANAINTAYGSAIATVTATSSGNYDIYKVSFTLAFSKASSTSAPMTVRTFTVGTSTIETFGEGYVFILQDTLNFPLFYDSANPSGFVNSGKYTCHTRRQNYKPWTYQTGKVSLTLRSLTHQYSSYY
jgi:hypothetical protein